MKIKFRAWNPIAKNMHIDDIYAITTDEKVNLKDGLMLSGCILMQYTGLKDKNGKEIYEGDIVKWSNSVNSGVYEIKWFRTGFSSNGLPLFNDDVVEVIGNIYENPELLALSPPIVTGKHRYLLN